MYSLYFRNLGKQKEPAPEKGRALPVLPPWFRFMTKRHSATYPSIRVPVNAGNAAVPTVMFSLLLGDGFGYILNVGLHLTQLSVDQNYNVLFPVTECIYASIKPKG